MAEYPTIRDSFFIQKNHLAYHNILALGVSNRNSEKWVVLIICALNDINFENMGKESEQLMLFVCNPSTGNTIVLILT